MGKFLESAAKDAIIRSAASGFELRTTTKVDMVIMAKSVYIETSVPSYLAARPSRDLLQSARQQITHEWWTRERFRFELCISQIVLDEAASGDSDAAQRRLELLAELPLLDLTTAVDSVVDAIMQTGLLPTKAVRDAIHIAV